MKCLLNIPTLALFLFSMVAVMPLSAQQKAKQGQEAQNEWSVQVYRYPSTELIGGFVSSEHGQLTPPRLPAANASETELIAFLKRSHFVMDQHLKIQGITLPQGSLAIFDPKNQTLALRSTQLAHERVRALSTMHENVASRLVSFSLQIIEADGATVREVLKKSTTQADHAPALAVLEALASQNKARYMANLRLETKSGNRASVSRGEDRYYVSEMTVDEARRSTTVMEQRIAGTVLELEPTIGADGTTLELTYSLQHHHTPPLVHWDKISYAGEHSVESPNIDFRLAHVTTGITLLNGMTKLLGIWQPEEVKEPERAKNLQAAFLRTNVVTLLPALDTRVEQLLKQHGEKAEKTPTAPPPEPPGATKGIITRSYHITEDLLTTGDSFGAAAPAAAADPFAAGGGAAPMANEGRMTMRITAVEILKSQGIPFPEGSSANFKAATGELLVRNTAENMALVDAFIDSLKQRAPHNLFMTLHIIEGDAATIRQVEQSTATTTDHTAAWQSVEQSAAQNKLRILRSALMETKSGMRSTFSTGREFIYASETNASTQETTTDNNSTPGTDKDTKTLNTTNIKISSNAVTRFSHASEMRPVGLRIEAEPTIMADVSTVELSYALEYDYAQPSVLDSELQPDAKTIRPLNRNIQFHQAKITTSTTIAGGTHRLLSVWKPEGTPEFDKADVLQAAFLSIDIVPVERSEKKP